MAYHNLINVALQPRTYQRLRTLGKTPDSFNDIIERLLDANEKKMQKKEEVRKGEAIIQE